jgi:hypothetical protein
VLEGGGGRIIMSRWYELMKGFSRSEVFSGWDWSPENVSEDSVVGDEGNDCSSLCDVVPVGVIVSALERESNRLFAHGCFFQASVEYSVFGNNRHDVATM